MGLSLRWRISERNNKKWQENKDRRSIKITQPMQNYSTKSAYKQHRRRQNYKTQKNSNQQTTHRWSMLAISKQQRLGTHNHPKDQKTLDLDSSSVSHATAVTSAWERRENRKKRQNDNYPLQATIDLRRSDTVLLAVHCSATSRALPLPRRLSGLL